MSPVTPVPRFAAPTELNVPPTPTALVEGLIVKLEVVNNDSAAAVALLLSTNAGKNTAFVGLPAVSIVVAAAEGVTHVSALPFQVSTVLAVTGAVTNPVALSPVCTNNWFAAPPKILLAKVAVVKPNTLDPAINRMISPAFRALLTTTVVPLDAV